MKIVKFFLLVIILFLSRNLLPQIRITPPAPERERTYDLLHVKINLSFDWNEKKVIGNVETKIAPLKKNFKEFEVDAVDFDISYIRDADNKSMNYLYDGNKIKIELDKSMTPENEIVYTVDYSCKPQRGLYFIMPEELNPSMPYQIWTQGEDEDNRYWIPIYDYPNDKTTFEIFATIDNKFNTLSNGYLEESKQIDAEHRQDHWVMDKPTSTYLIMFTAGEYNIVNNRSGNIPVNYYTGKNIEIENTEYTFRNTPAMMKFFSEVFIPYPWNKYSQVVVEDFTFGGMENTTATVMSKRGIHGPQTENDFSFDETIAHELGHQWWGDLITAKNWSEIWLNEGFATYSAALWDENYFGKDEYDYDLLLNGDFSIRSDSVTGKYPVWAGYGRSTTKVYSKASVVLKTFRYILGDEIFFGALRNFLKENSYKNVATQDLLNSINKEYNSVKNSNEDLKWMFDDWIWKGGYPVFNVDYKYDVNSKQLRLNVRQIQKTDTLVPVFRIPVGIRIKTPDEDRIEKIDIRDDDETFVFSLYTKPEMVVFDYGKNVLGKVNFEKTFNELKMQFETSKDAIDRIMALRDLEKYLKGDESETAGKPPVTIDQLEAIKLFEQALISDVFWGVRAESAKILGRNFIVDRTSTVLKKAYDIQTNSKIQREILRALGNSKRSDDCDFIIEKIANQTNDYIVATGISAISKCISKDKIYDAVSPYVDRVTHRGVVQSAVINALSSSDDKTNDQRIKKIIMDIAFGPDIEGRLRADAISSLKKYASDEDVKKLAIKNLNVNFIVVKRALISLLSDSKDKSIIPVLNEINKLTTDAELSSLLQSAIKKLETN